MSNIRLLDTVLTSTSKPIYVVVISIVVIFDANNSIHAKIGDFFRIDKTLELDF